MAHAALACWILIGIVLFLQVSLKEPSVDVDFPEAEFDAALLVAGLLLFSAGTIATATILWLAKGRWPLLLACDVTTVALCLLVFRPPGPSHVGDGAPIYGAVLAGLAALAGALLVGARHAGRASGGSFPRTHR